MNPPESKGPEYDQGYADGYRARGVQQLVIDLRETNSLTQDDLEYLSELCRRMPPSAKKVLEIVQ